MSITVIIPTVNEPTLEKVIQVTKSELRDAEIIVVGFGPSKDIAKRNRVDFLDMIQKTSKPIGINKAVNKAKNNWIIVLDADAIPQPGWGKSMLSTFQAGKQIFSGSVDISHGNFWMKVYNLSSCNDMIPQNKAEFRKSIPAVNMGFTKNVFNVAGDWDENLPRGQDYEWTLRLYRKGITPWFEPQSCVVHFPAGLSTFKSVWNTWKRKGYYDWIVRIKYSDTLHTPGIFYSPLLVILLAPILALVPTFKIFRTSPINFFKYFHLLPFVYLTKIAWCWGVFKAPNNS